MDITVIVPARNEERNVGRAVKSLLEGGSGLVFDANPIHFRYFPVGCRSLRTENFQQLTEELNEGRG